MKRNTGETTRQMQAAAEGAVYIWNNTSLTYPRELATFLGRDDLIIVSPYWLDFERWQGRRCPEIVVDHALELNDFRKVQLSLARAGCCR